MRGSLRVAHDGDVEQGSTHWRLEGGQWRLIRNSNHPRSFEEVRRRQLLAVCLLGLLFLTFTFLWQSVDTSGDGSGSEDTDPGNPMTAMLLMAALFLFYSWSKENAEAANAQNAAQAQMRAEEAAMLLVPGPHHPPPPAAPTIDVEMALRALPLTAYKKPPPSQQQPAGGEAAASTVEAGSSEGTSSTRSGAARDGDGAEAGAKGQAGGTGRASSASASCAGPAAGHGVGAEQEGGAVPAVQPGAKEGAALQKEEAAGPSGGANADAASSGAEAGGSGGKGLAGGKGALTSRPSCGGSSDSDECPCCVVCLDPVREGDLVLTLPCSHNQFHAACITPWLRQQAGEAACPLCKAPVFGAQTEQQQQQQAAP